MIKLTTDLRETVIAIAQDAAAAIMAVYATPFDVEIKSDERGSCVVDGFLPCFQFQVTGGNVGSEDG